MASLQPRSVWVYRQRTKIQYNNELKIELCPYLIKFYFSYFIRNINLCIASIMVVPVDEKENATDGELRHRDMGRDARCCPICPILRQHET